MIEKGKNLIPGLLLSALVAMIAIALSGLLPGDIIGATVMALLVGMALNPFFMKHQQLYSGVTFSSKKILRLGIILMGVNLNFAEVWDVGKYALFLMIFTMLTAFGVGNLIGKFFGDKLEANKLISSEYSDLRRISGCSGWTCYKSET